MRIAWRYNALPSIDASQKLLTYFDSSKRIDRQMLTNADIEYFKPTDEPIETERSFHNSVYGQILVNLRTKLNNLTFSTEVESDGAAKSLLRISISALGSPLWYDDAFAEDVCLFLYCLKALIRTSLAVGCITVPNHLFKYVVSAHSTDACAELSETLCAGRQSDSAYPQYGRLLRWTGVVCWFR